MIFYLMRLIKSWLKPKYEGQIVFQWPAESMTDYDRLIEIENTIRQGLGPIGLVDGHDIGGGEMNVFIHTNEPLAVFQKTLSLIQGKFDVKDLMVGYRKFDEDNYIPMYPPGLEFFRVS